MRESVIERRRVREEVLRDVNRFYGGESRALSVHRGGFRVCNVVQNLFAALL